MKFDVDEAEPNYDLLGVSLTMIIVGVLLWVAFA